MVAENLKGTEPPDLLISGTNEHSIVFCKTSLLQPSERHEFNIHFLLHITIKIRIYLRTHLKKKNSLARPCRTFLMLHQIWPGRSISTNESQTRPDLTSAGNRLYHYTFPSPEFKRTLPKQQPHKAGVKQGLRALGTPEVLHISQAGSRDSSCSLPPFKVFNQNQHPSAPAIFTELLAASTETEKLKTFISPHGHVVTRASCSGILPCEILPLPL